MARISDFIQGFWRRRHPWSRLAAIGLALAFFLLTPDRGAGTLSLKILLAAALILIPSRFEARRWLKMFLPWASFTLLVGAATLISSIFSGNPAPFSSPGFRAFITLALRSFWLVNAAFSASLSFSYPELVFLARRLPFGGHAASQVLLVVMTWSKLLAEFGHVPLAWKSRGLKRGLPRPARAARCLFQAALLRSLDKAYRLEIALIGRGFRGRFYTLWTSEWKAADSLFLAAAAMVFVLLAGSTRWI